jgi:hypothetical protein
VYSQAPNDIPNGYSGSAFAKEAHFEPEEETAAEASSLPTAAAPRRSILSFFDRFHIGRYLKGFDLEDLLILALAFLLLLEDGEDDLFPFLLLFLFIQ